MSDNPFENLPIDKLDGLYYTSTDNILFWVAGYRQDSYVDLFIKFLQNDKEKFIGSGATGTIHTFRVEESRRYKNMWVYWCKQNVPPSMESGVYVIDNPSWTMQKWVLD